MSLKAVAKQSSFSGVTNFGLAFTDTSGTPGNATISTPRGRCSIAALGTTVTITSTIVTATSTILAVVSTNDATAVLKNVVPGAGSFVITLNAATTGITNIDFIVVNS
jgi:hypothetical protein